MGRRDERSRSRGRSRSPRRHRSAERSRRRSRSRSRSADRAHSRRKRSYSRSSSRGRSHHRHSSRDRYSGRSSPRDSRDRRRSRSTSKERSRRSRSSSYSRSRRSRSPRRESRHRSPSYNNHHDDRRSHQDSSREHYRRDSRDRQRESSRDRHRETSRDRPREPSRDSHRNGSDSFASKQKEPPKNQESAPALVGHATPADPRRDNRGRGDIKESETHKTLSAPQQAPDQSQTHPEVRKQNLPALDTSAPPSVESTPASTPLPVFHSRPATKVTVVVPEDPAAKRRRFQREEAYRTYLKSTVLRAKAEAKFETAMAKVYLAETWLNFVDKTVEDVGRRIELQDWKFKKMDDGMSLEELLEAPATDEPEPEVTQL